MTYKNLSKEDKHRLKEEVMRVLEEDFSKHARLFNDTLKKKNFATAREYKRHLQGLSDEIKMVDHMDPSHVASKYPALIRKLERRHPGEIRTQNRYRNTGRFFLFITIIVATLVVAPILGTTKTFFFVISLFVIIFFFENMLSKNKPPMLVTSET